MGENVKIGGRGDGSGLKAVVVCETMGAGVQNPRIQWEVWLLLIIPALGMQRQAL